ncbi:MAG TPA: PQQ-dependent sugar dehydrogenase [Verrucomicrobiae bacterium]
MCLVANRGDTGLQRVTPTGVRMPLVPGTATEYRVENEAFPGVEFYDPVAIVSAPTEPNRLYIIERQGRVILIRDLNSPQREVFMDISARVNSNYTETETGAEGLNCIAFHPNHAQNGYFYVVYTHRAGGVNYNRLSRFTKSSADRGNPDSELVMIDQPDTGYGHNFNDVKFGPDGFLYVAVGDEGDGRGAGDEYQNSQRIDKDFFSAILRLDVDTNRFNDYPNAHPAMKGGYRIPADNPYVDATSFNGKPVDRTKVRTEFWAVGFRNPWRLFFDQDGTLYAGDVGRHDREEINIVKKAGNYGWAFVEGATTGSALGAPPAGVTLTPPIVEYPHGWGAMSGNCVIGGVVYRGSKLPDLYGAYVFGDFVTGNIWSLRHNGSSATEWKKIAGLYDISGFGIDPRNGDILVCKDKLDGDADGIYRLEAKPGSGATIPATLADTGLFSNLASLTAANGLVPFEVNSPLWSDGADKKRWFGILDNASIIQFSRDGNWTFPQGTIWVKHFDLELEKGNPASRKRIETRVLVKNNSANGIYGVTYRWGDSTNNATLVPDEGASDTFTIRENGTNRTQAWKYPGRSDCLACHTSSGGYSLGFNTAQLNRDFQYSLARTNQLIALRNAGYIDGPNTNINTLRRLVSVHDQEWSREYRVRSYLAVNCANCHNPSGVERGRWDGRINTLLAEMKLIHGELLDSFGHASNRVVVPGDPSRSVLLTRMKTHGQGRMPPLGSSVTDQDAVKLIEDWIRDDLKTYKTYEQWIATFATAETNRLDDVDDDGADNYLEYLLSSNPTNSTDAFAITVTQTNGTARLLFPQIANRGFEVNTANSVTSQWSVVDIHSNRPFFAATNRIGTVDFPIGSGQNSFYRVRVFEP